MLRLVIVIAVVVFCCIDYQNNNNNNNMMVLSKPKRPPLGRHHRYQCHHRRGPISLLACFIAASSFLLRDYGNDHVASSSSSSSWLFVHADDNTNNIMNNNNNAVVSSSSSFQQVFQAIDSNHDHTISEDEYLVAVNKLVGGGDAGGVGVVDSIGGAGVVGVTSGNSAGAGDAPPLGMDYNPFASRGGSKNIVNSNTNNISSSATATTTTAFFKGLFSSFSAIIATEIGDKTFFIAAVLSMRNDRFAVFGGAILALIIMTILSTLLGLVLPALLPKKYTHIIGGLLFLYFGIKLLLDSRSMQKNKVSEELEEVEEELAEMSKKQSKARKKKRAEEEGGKGRGKQSLTGGATEDDDTTTVDIEDGGIGRGQQIPQQQQIENGDADNMNGAKKRRGGGANGGTGGGSSSGRTIKHAPSSSGLSAAGNYSGGSWESVFVQSLTLTFLAEWGDRSQIATIALAAAKDPVGVAIGGCIGHSVCTGMAVIGGRMLASRISEKSVAFYGGLVFLVFGMHSVFFEE